MFSIFRKRKRPLDCSYPGTTNIIWNKAIAMMCDKYSFKQNFSPDPYINIKEGDTVWVKGDKINEFFDHFPQLETPFVLVTANATQSMPLEADRKKLSHFLKNSNLIHWFAQNFDPIDELSGKTSPIPLGVDFHSQYERTSWRYSELKTPADQEEILLAVKEAAPKEKIPLCHAGFHFNNSTRHLLRRDPKIKKDRKMIYKELKNNPAIYFQKKKMPRDDLWKEMTRYQFAISPHGSGLDCHRTWEALALGIYVIVESSTLDPLYKGLPVKILEDYQEITTDNLLTWAEEFKEKYDYNDYFHLLTNQYWYSKIEGAKLSHP